MLSSIFHEQFFILQFSCELSARPKHFLASLFCFEALQSTCIPYLYRKLAPITCVKCRLGLHNNQLVYVMETTFRNQSLSWATESTLAQFCHLTANKPKAREREREGLNSSNLSMEFPASIQTNSVIVRVVNSRRHLEKVARRDARRSQRRRVGESSSMAFISCDLRSDNWVSDWRPHSCSVIQFSTLSHHTI